MSNEIIKVLDDLSQRFGIIIDWTDKNVLPYLLDLTEKIVNYEIVTSIFWIVFSILIMTISLKWIKNEHSVLCKTEANVEEFLKGCLCIVSFVLIVIFFICFMVQIFDIIKCICLPEKVIFDFIKSEIMINNVN